MLGQYNSLGEYCGLSTASEEFLILILVSCKVGRHTVTYVKMINFCNYTHINIIKISIGYKLFPPNYLAIQILQKGENKIRWNASAETD